MNNKGLFGPFENSDDINKYWYQVTEEELEENIQRVKEDLEDPDLTKDDIKIYKQDLKGLSMELASLRSFVDDYTRCTERYKFNKKVLRRIHDDWTDYNISLYGSWTMIQARMLDPDMGKGKRLKRVQAESKSERIKREEIEKRIGDLLAE